MSKVGEYKVSKLAVNDALVASTAKRVKNGESLSALVRSGVASTSGRVAMLVLLATTPRVKIDDPSALARAVAANRKSGDSWGVISARYLITEGCARRAFTAASGLPYSALDYRRYRGGPFATAPVKVAPASAPAKPRAKRAPKAKGAVTTTA